MVTVNLLMFVVVPAGLLAWLGFGRISTRLTGLLKLVVVGLYLAAIWKSAGWQIVSVHLRWVWLSLFVLAGSRAALQLPETPWWEAGVGRGWRAVLLGVLALLFGAAFLAMTRGRQPAGEPVDLQFPLRDGRFYVASGGSVPWVNPHMKVLGPEKYRGYRGQGYAIDVVQLNVWGARAGGLYPSNLEAYEIFGAPVHAPCAGEVVQMEEDIPDQPPPSTAEQNREGNHVFLKCEDFRVLLAHLKQGSVSVAAGDRVRAGQKLGVIGNSGSSTEPHLHIHAERPADEGGFMSGEPLPMLFNGRFLTNNTIVDARTVSRK